MKTKALAISAMIGLIAIVTIISCSKQEVDQTAPSTFFSTHKAVENPNLPGITSDLMLFSYLNLHNPIMEKLSLEAKDQLLQSASFQFRGFLKTGNLYTELTPSEIQQFNDYSVRIASCRELNEDFNNPNHPLTSIFSKLSPSTKTSLVNNAVFQFHGFDYERLMRESLNCEEYNEFYNIILGKEVTIAYAKPCVCSEITNPIPMPDGMVDPPCTKTKTLQNYKWNGGSTWTKSDCDSENWATCVICDDGATGD